MLRSFAQTLPFLTCFREQAYPIEMKESQRLLQLFFDSDALLFQPFCVGSPAPIQPFQPPSMDSTFV